MSKFLAIVKREYIQRVRAKMFIVSTILLPLVMSLFGVVPAIILNIEVGGPLRVAVVDQTGKMYAPLQAAVVGEEESEKADEQSASQNANSTPRDSRRFGGSRNFQLTEVKMEGRSADEVRADPAFEPPFRALRSGIHSGLLVYEDSHLTIAAGVDRKA